MSSKSQTVAALVQRCQDRGLDPRYLAFFECFDRQLFFEAHEVLEELWLVRRGTAKGRFYQGLIQVAGAFVHVQKQRLRPASALLELARANLEPYTPVCDRLDVAALIERIGGWLGRMRSGKEPGLLAPGETPIIELQAPGSDV